MADLKIAVVCSSNQNRSMEAHAFLSKKGFQVKSFGTGAQVKLPGPSPDKPNVYDFCTTYDQMHKDLVQKDNTLQFIKPWCSEEGHCITLSYYPVAPNQSAALNRLYPVPNHRLIQTGAQHHQYTQNGILHMLDRNRRIKPRPERFQSSKERFDIVVTCEERVYDQVVEDLETRDSEADAPVHVINIDIQDNHEEATIGAFLICDLCQMLQDSDDLENDMDEILQAFEEKCNRPILHSVSFY